MLLARMAAVPVRRAGVCPPCGSAARCRSMTIYRFEIDGDKDVEAIALSLTLLASKIFHDRFPGPIQQEGWQRCDGNPCPGVSGGENPRVSGAPSLQVHFSRRLDCASEVGTDPQ